MKQPKTYWIEFYLGTEHALESCKSWFAPLTDGMTPYKAEVLCDIATDRERKLRAFMKDADGKEFKFERTMGRNFTVRRVAL